MVRGGIAHGDDLQYLFYTGIFTLSESINNHVVTNFTSNYFQTGLTRPWPRDLFAWC